MAEISIPVRIRLAAMYISDVFAAWGTKERRDIFFLWNTDFPFAHLDGINLEWCDVFSPFSFSSSSSSALVLIGVSLSRECEPCLDSARRWFVESSGFSF
jgi:hypothetical protein